MHDAMNSLLSYGAWRERRQSGMIQATKGWKMLFERTLARMSIVKCSYQHLPAPLVTWFVMSWDGK